MSFSKVSSPKKKSVKKSPAKKASPRKTASVRSTSHRTAERERPVRRVDKSSFFEFINCHFVDFEACYDKLFQKK